MTQKDFKKQFEGKYIREISWEKNFFIHVLFVSKKFVIFTEKTTDNRTVENWDYVNNVINKSWQLYQPQSDQILEAPEGYTSPAIITNEFLSAFSNEFFSNKTEVDKKFSCYSSKVTWPATILINGKEEPLWIKIK